MPKSDCLLRSAEPIILAKHMISGIKLRRNRSLLNGLGACDLMQTEMAALAAYRSWVRFLKRYGLVNLLSASHLYEAQ
jgi:hypothetical protein